VRDPGTGVGEAPARRVRLVVPRYGPGVPGGSEGLVRRLASALSTRRWEVEVWTTTAGEERTWAPAFPPGDDLDGDVRVRRFPVAFRRRAELFRQLHRGMFRLPPRLRPETAWVVAQGPFAPALVRALATGRDRPTLFTPYLYHPTLWGIPAAPHPRLLIPAAHDEPALRLRAVGRALAAADALWYHSGEERRLVETVQPIARQRPFAVGTVGIEPPDGLDRERFRSVHRLGRYLLCAGRVTPGKGVELLLRGFAGLRRSHPDVSLVLIGDPAGMPDPPEGVVALGWVSESERWFALAGAEAVVVPSRLESLSLVALEAWACGRPCAVNGDSPVLAGQARRSGGALLFSSPDGLAEAAARLLDDAPLAERLGTAGRDFVAAGYRWDDVVARLEALLAAGRARGGGRPPGWDGGDGLPGGPAGDPEAGPW
jgi:glycosyltransferase involved in cell wall biosynthesis